MLPRGRNARATRGALNTDDRIGAAIDQVERPGMVEGEARSQLDGLT
jgi:hypothetical protein